MVFLWFSFACFSQKPGLIFRHITRSTGLPVDDVTCLAQDSTGFIWIGTSEGLFRFDGFNYRPFYASFDKSSSLHSNYIKKLYTDSKGRLWIATYDKGLSVLEPGDTSISQVTGILANNPAAKPEVNDIKEDNNGFLWFTTMDGLLRSSPDRKTWKQYKLNSKTVRDNEFFQFDFDEKNRLMIGGIAGFLIFDAEREKFTIPESGFKKVFEKRTYFRSLIYHTGNIWFTTWADDLGVYKVSREKLNMLYANRSGEQPDLSKLALLFYPDSKGGLWIGTDNGLQFVSPGSDTITRSYYHQANNPYSLLSSKISSVMEDREGNLWVGTDEGLSIAEPYKGRVLNYSVNDVQQFPFGNKEVNDIVELDDHSILIGTYNADGIYHTDREFDLQKRIAYGNVSFDWIWKHYKYEKGKKVYIATQEGMLIYDQVKKRIYKAEDSIFSNGHTVSSMLRLSDDEVWASYFRNVFFRYNLRTRHYKAYNITSLGEPSQVLFLRLDKDNQLWILGHSSGLLQFDEQKEKIVKRFTPDSTFNSLRQSGVWVFLDLGESFLIGYDTHGMSLYHKRTQQFEHFTQNEGLPSNRIRDAFVASDNTVWMATANGICHFDPVNKTFINYSYAQGILNNDIECIYPMSGGRIIAGTNKGVVVFKPDEIIPAIPPLPPVVSDVYVLNKKISIASPVGGYKSINLSHKENYFSFEFITPQYSNTNQVEYAYQLEGLQKDWVVSGRRRFVSYANLPAGNYVFKMKCRLPGGTWVENKEPIYVTVNAAFYTRWWFFLSIGLVIASIVYAFFRYRVQQLLRLESMRSSISSDLHDEVGTSLTSISIFSEIARKAALPLSKEEEYLQRIGDRSRESIDKMRDIVWSINPNNDSLEQMIGRMKNYTKEVAEAKSIAIHWNEEGPFHHSKLSMEHRKNLYLLYKEGVSNVIKHACAKNIHIFLEFLKNGMTLSITDDGKGFDVENAQAGNGLKSMKRRTTFLRGTIDIVSCENGGTSIRLSIPY